MAQDVVGLTAATPSSRALINRRTGQMLALEAGQEKHLAAVTMTAMKSRLEAISVAGGDARGALGVAQAEPPAVAGEVI